MGWPRRKSSIAQRWRSVVDRKDLIGGCIRHVKDQFEYHSRILAISLDGNSLKVGVEWSAKIPLNEDGYVEGKSWTACQCSDFCFDLASSNGPNAYFFVDTDGCVYFGFDDGRTWALIPKNIVTLKREDVVGLG